MMNTLASSSREYAAVIGLEKIVSRRTLHVLRISAFIGMVLCAIASIVVFFILQKGGLLLVTGGGFLLFFAIWIEQILLFSYHNSFYFKGLHPVIDSEDAVQNGVTYDVAEAILPHQDDVTFAFCTSTLGSTVLLRASISSEAVAIFLTSPRQKIIADTVVLPEHEVFSLLSLGTYLLTHDTDFKELIKRQGISDATFLATIRWVIGTYHQEKRQLQWWSKDTLSRTQGIGREWTYGTAYLLEQFSRSIHTSAIFSTLTLDSAYAEEKVKEIETTLARGKTANILLLGEPGVGTVDLIMAVEKRIVSGEALHSIAGAHIIVLDTTRLFAARNQKQSLEMTLLSLFDEALYAGNTIIVIENLSTMLREAEALGVFIPELLDVYLSSPQLHIIATDTPGNYHTFLEPLGAFTRRFTEILIDTPDNSATIRVLQPIALENEMRYQTLFTYPSLEAIAVAADRYLIEGVMPDKAVGLLIDVASAAQNRSQSVITSEFVYQVVGEKTGIPTGPISDTERDLLLHLEDTLHQQVIGQERAIDAIARTMRRARAGIQSSEKPIGSFLFLGPTGVGKTETAKALATIFFGDESLMHRFDMSEYSGVDALERLLGTTEHTGTLPNMLREHPYAVVLLDEFEKASRSVHDLFLQILDEGVCTDGRGEKVNARNTIIIATSNAGSALIMRTVEQRKELAHLTEEIITTIIRDGVFRPELINRFDSTVIFEPLTRTEQGQVARLLLGGLYERVKEKGYELIVNQDLLEILVTKGYHPEFGARPMQRVLQDLVEEKIAQKIISGSVTKGDTITITKADFSDKELQ
jgi:ATP-dependent Clp protease ATP-binding subunit ClpC